MQAWKLKGLGNQHCFPAYSARRARYPNSSRRRGVRLTLVRGHAELLVAALLPVLRLALGPAVAHELAAGAGAEGDAGLLGEAAVGALPAARQRLLRVGHVALRGRSDFHVDYRL